MREIPLNVPIHFDLINGELICIPTERVSRLALCLAAIGHPEASWNIEDPTCIYSPCVWKILSEKDLPLYVGWPYVWPLMARVIQDGKLPGGDIIKEYLNDGHISKICSNFPLPLKRIK
jgi:hypothetical protein